MTKLIAKIETEAIISLTAKIEAEHYQGYFNKAMHRALIHKTCTCI